MLIQVIATGGVGIVVISDARTGIVHHLVPLPGEDQHDQEQGLHDDDRGGPVCHGLV